MTAFAGAADRWLFWPAIIQIASPQGQAKNLFGFKKNVFGWCGGHTRHLLGHYYVCDF